MKSTAKDWDEVRSAFATSIMVDTALSSLAQNLDGPDWPIKGKDETGPGIPESFNVLVKELQGLGLDIEVLDEKDNPISLEKLVEEKLSMIR